jgi:hypothetical protein
MSLFQKYNNEDILVRAVIAGLLNILNNKINYKQVWSNTDIEDVRVPWYYNQSGDERFMQDFYTFYAWCTAPRPIDGNFDMIPRGVITYTGSPINAQRITSRFVQGRYLKEIDGKLQSYISYLYPIPLDMAFDCEMWIDTHITALKIEQIIRDVFYKTITFYVYYKGLRVGCQVGFPENYMVQKNIQYSFEQDNRIKITFSLEVETYQPVFDTTTEMSATSTIKAFAYRIYDPPEKYDGDIYITSPANDIVLPKGIPLWVEWIYNREGAVINKVDVSWTDTSTLDRNTIEKFNPNHEYYVWNIPEDFTDFNQPVLIWEETDNVKIIRTPEIKIVPDTSSKIIDASSFYVTEEGYFFTQGTDASISLLLEMKNDNSQLVYSSDNGVVLNIKYNKLDQLNLINYLEPNLTFPGTIDYKYIDLYISNSVNPDHYGVKQRIKIV